ncbi:MAG: hypothetical protein E7120_03440 [Bacteroidales bacterium]|nr:hypothetical protein [Bacteroidales bacterium]
MRQTAILVVILIATACSTRIEDKRFYMNWRYINKSSETYILSISDESFIIESGDSVEFQTVASSMPNIKSDNISDYLNTDELTLERNGIQENLENLTDISNYIIDKLNNNEYLIRYTFLD